MAIDLSKLKALELPSEDIDIEILGEKQTVKIICPGEDTAATVSTLYQQKGDYPNLTVDVMKIFVAAAMPELTQADIDLIVTRDFAAAVQIAKKARELMEDFSNLKKKSRFEIEKNFDAAESVPVKNC